MKKSTTYKGQAKPYGKSGHFHEPRRHSLQSRGIKTGNLGTSMPHKVSPYQYQDTHQERIIHSVWDKGNSYRHVLEGTGDIFRELTRQHPHRSYIEEKIARIERHINKVENPPAWDENDVEMFERRYGLDPKETGIHPEDSFEYAHKENEQKFETMKEQWRNQPTTTRLQRHAVRLNLAMLEGDFDEAERLIDRIEKGLEKRC